MTQTPVRVKEGTRYPFLCSQRSMRAWEEKLGKALAILRCPRMEQHILKVF